MNEAPPPRPLPDLEDRLHAPFWAGTAAGELRVQRCPRCGRHRWPPRPRCAECGSYDIAWEAVPPLGTLFSWIVARQAFLPAFAGAVPYVVAIVELDAVPGIRMLGNLVGLEPEAVRAGLPVHADFTPVGGIHLVNWRPRK